MMKIARLVCAIWMCSPLALQAGAAGAPLDRGPADRGPLEHGPAESSGHSSSARAQTQESARASSAKGEISKGGNTTAAVSQRPAAAQRGADPLMRSNADRLHSLLRTPATPAAKPPSRPAAGSSRAETTGTALSRTPGLQGASPASLSRLAVPKISARTPRSSNAPTPGALLGGPHPGGPVALGGPAMGRAASGRTVSGRAATANGAVLDGTQMRRRF
jgi:hypothetical protein